MTKEERIKQILDIIATGWEFSDKIIGDNRISPLDYRLGPANPDDITHLRREFSKLHHIDKVGIFGNQAVAKLKNVSWNEKIKSILEYYVNGAPRTRLSLSKLSSETIKLIYTHLRHNKAIYDGYLEEAGENLAKAAELVRMQERAKAKQR